MTKSAITVDREKREIVMTRTFDASRDLVFKTYTNPDLLPQWWGINSTTIVDKMDVRPGGAWRYVEHSSDGKEYAFNGVYQEVVPPERLVYTFEFEGMPGHVLLATVIFEEHNGQTRLTDISAFKTLEDLEGMLQSGMEEGANYGWERLTTLLSTLQMANK